MISTRHEHRSIRRIALAAGFGLAVIAAPAFADPSAHHERGFGSTGHGYSPEGYGSPHGSPHARGYGHGSSPYRGHTGYGTYRHGHGPHRSASRYIHHILRFKDAMAITDEQAARLREIDTTYRKQRIRLKADIEIANLELHQLLRDDHTPLSAIQEKLQALHALKAELQLAGIKAKREANAVLTDEQRKRMKMVHERIEAAMERHGAHPGGSPHHGKKHEEPHE